MEQQNKSIGQLLMEGWKKNSVSYFEYIDLAKKIGKEQALRQHTPIMIYIDLAYFKYKYLCYYFGQEALNKGAWLRSRIIIA